MALGQTVHVDRNFVRSPLGWPCPHARHARRDVFDDAKGEQRDWWRELTDALAKRQKENGSWVNAADRWLEGDPNLTTAYSLMALKYCNRNSGRGSV